VLFTEYGISGIAVFEISRFASFGPQPMDVSLDFMPDWTEPEVTAFLRERRGRMHTLPTEQFLAGILNKRLGQMVIKSCSLSFTRPSAELTDAEIASVAKAVKRVTLAVTGTTGFQNAQVTAGGIKTSEFDPETMESRLCPGLYAAGEVLDIDGACGGYNLQWAWSSGFLAGRSSAL
jgi:predicted Rossmann fold flavoprotein